MTFDGFDKELETELKSYKKCRVCGGYGWNYPSGGRSAQKCPSCKGDKISRDPRDYADKQDIPPLPR